MPWASSSYDIADLTVIGDLSIDSSDAKDMNVDMLESLKNVD